MAFLTFTRINLIIQRVGSEGPATEDVHGFGLVAHLFLKGRSGKTQRCTERASLHNELPCGFYIRRY